MESERGTEGGGVGVSELSNGRRKDRLEVWVFGFLYALRRKKVEHVRVSTLGAFLDLIQLIPFVAIPRIAWDGASADIITKYVGRLQLVGNFTVTGDYEKFKAVFWACFAAILVTLLLAAAIARRAATGGQQLLWQLRMMRRLLILVPGALCVSLLGVFWEPWRCMYRDAPSYAEGKLAAFPTVACWGAANMPHAIVGAIMGVLTLLLSVASTLAMFDPDLRTRQPQALASLPLPLLGIMLRAALVLAVVSLQYVPFWMAVFVSVVFLYWLLSKQQEMPHHSAVGNVVRSAWLGGLTAAAVWQVIVQLFRRPSAFTWIGASVAAFAVGAVISGVMAARFLQSLNGSSPTITRMSPNGTEFVVVTKFAEPAHVPICTRFLREGRVTGDGLEQAEAIWTAAQKQFGDLPWLLIGYANHVFSYSNDFPKATHLLDRAARLRPGILARFVLFIREQEGLQRRARAQGNDTTMDLMTYVEFQAQYKVTLRAHRRILQEVRKFWRLVHGYNLYDDTLQQHKAALAAAIALAAQAAAGPSSAGGLGGASSSNNLGRYSLFGLAAASRFLSAASHRHGPGAAAAAAAAASSSAAGSQLHSAHGSLSSMHGPETPRGGAFRAKSPPGSAGPHVASPPGGGAFSAAKAAAAKQHAGGGFSVTRDHHHHHHGSTGGGGGNHHQHGHGTHGSHHSAGGSHGSHQHHHHSGHGTHHHGAAAASASDHAHSGPPEPRPQLQTITTSAATGQHHRASIKHAAASTPGGMSAIGLSSAWGSPHTMSRDGSMHDLLARTASTGTMESGVDSVVLEGGLGGGFGGSGASIASRRSMLVAEPAACWCDPARLLRSLRAWATNTLELHDTVITRGGSVTRLARCCVEIDRLSKEGERGYLALLEKYPKSSKVLRAYARFHMEINQNAREAERYFAEADKLDEGAADEAANGALDRDGQLKVTSLVDDTVDALIVINARGIILSVNSNCRRMFGYSEHDVIGRNVSMLMPPIYAAQHDSFLHNYVTTGVSKVIGKVRRLEGRHRDGHTFPIDLAVSRVETPQGLNFAGVIHAIPEDEAVGLCTTNDKGAIISCNKAFCKMFGWSVMEAVGANISRFMPRQFAKNHDAWIGAYKRTGRSAAIGTLGRRLQGLHKNGMVFPVSVELAVQQLGSQILFTARLFELTNAAGVVTIDERGIVQSCNKAMLNIFGLAAPNDIVGRNVSRLMPEPYASFHDSYLKRYMQHGQGRIVGAEGRYVMAKHTDNTQFPVKLKITELKAKKGSKDGKRMFAAEITLISNAATQQQESKGAGDLDDDGIAAGVDALGDTATAGEADPLLGRISISAEGRMLFVSRVLCEMFGYTSQELLGKNVSMLMAPEIAAHHDDYLKKHAETGENRVVGTIGRHLMGLHVKGYLFPISLAVEEESIGGKTTYHGSIRSLSEIEGVLIADLQGTILNVNQGLCYLFGYRSSELEGHNVTKIMTREYRKAHNGYLKKYRETGQRKFIGRRQVVPAKHSDGSVISIQLEAVDVKHATYGRCLMARIVAAAVTPEEAAAAAAEAVKRANETHHETSGVSEDDNEDGPGGAAKRAARKAVPLDASGVPIGCLGGAAAAAAVAAGAASGSGVGGDSDREMSGIRRPLAKRAASFSRKAPTTPRTAKTISPGYGGAAGGDAPPALALPGRAAAAPAGVTPLRPIPSRPAGSSSTPPIGGIASPMASGRPPRGSITGMHSPLAIHAVGGAGTGHTPRVLSPERSSSGGSAGIGIAASGPGRLTHQSSVGSSRGGSTTRSEAGSTTLRSTSRSGRRRGNTWTRPIDEVPLPEDNRWIFSDARGNTVSFQKAATSLGFLHPDGSLMEDNTPPYDLHMEGKPGGWVGLYVLGTAPEYVLPGKDHSAPDWRDAGLIPPRRRPATDDELDSTSAPRTASVRQGGAATAADGFDEADFEAGPYTAGPTARRMSTASGAASAAARRRMSIGSDGTMALMMGLGGGGGSSGRGGGGSVELFDSPAAIRATSPLAPKGVRRSPAPPPPDGSIVAPYENTSKVIRLSAPPSPAMQPPSAAPPVTATATSDPEAAVPMATEAGTSVIEQGSSATGEGSVAIEGAVPVSDADIQGGSDAEDEGEGGEMEGQSEVLSEPSAAVREEDIMYDDYAATETHGDDDDDKASAAQHSVSMSMFGGGSAQEKSRAKHRFRQLKRIRRNQGIRTTIARMTSLTTMLAVVVAVFITAAFATSQALVGVLESDVELVAAASERAAAMQQISYLARSLQLSVALNDNSSATTANTALQYATNRAFSLHNSLYLGASDTSLSNHYLTPVIDIQRYVGTASPPTYITQKYGFWDAANLYLAAANLLVSPADTNLLDLSLDAAGVLLDGANATIRDTAAWRFILDNSGVIVGHAITSAELELQFVEGLVTTLAAFQIAAFCAVVSAILLLIQFVLRPMYRKLARERSAQFGLFDLLPRKVTLELASMRLRVGRADGDDEDSDTSASENSSDSDDDNTAYRFHRPSTASLAANKGGQSHGGGPRVPPPHHEMPAKSAMKASGASVASGGHDDHLSDAETASAAPPASKHGRRVITGDGAHSVDGRGASAPVTPTAGRPSLPTPSNPKGGRPSAKSPAPEAFPISPASSFGGQRDAAPRRSACAGCRPCFLCLRRWQMIFSLLFNVFFGGIFSVLGPLFSCKRPISTPRKLGYSILALLALLSINLAVSRTQLINARTAILHTHFDDRVSTLVSRVRFLAQEMAYVSSPAVNGLAPQPPPAPNVLSTSPSLANLKLGLRSAVSLAQRTVDAATTATTITTMPGTGDGVMDAAFLQSAALSYYTVESSELAYTLAHPSSSVDDVNREALRAALLLTNEQAALLPRAAAADLSTLMASPLTASSVSTASFSLGCMRAGGTQLGPDAAAMLTANFRALTNGRTEVAALLQFPSNYSFPVIIPADASACVVASHPEAAFLTNGFDVALRSTLQQAWMLSNETDANLVPWNTRWRFIQLASQLDIADACWARRAQHLDIAKTSLRTLHLSESIIFVVCVLLVLTWYFALLRPYISHISYEMSRVAALLSFLPSGIDLQKLIRLHDQRRDRRVKRRQFFRR